MHFFVSCRPSWRQRPIWSRRPWWRSLWRQKSRWPRLQLETGIRKQHVVALGGVLLMLTFSFLLLGWTRCRPWTRTIPLGRWQHPCSININFSCAFVVAIFCLFFLFFFFVVFLKIRNAKNQNQNIIIFFLLLFLFLVCFMLALEFLLLEMMEKTQK